MRAQHVLLAGVGLLWLVLAPAAQAGGGRRGLAADGGGVGPSEAAALANAVAPQPIIHCHSPDDASSCHALSARDFNTQGTYT